MSLISQSKTYYWTSMAIISQSRVCYWSSLAIVNECKACHWTSMPSISFQRFEIILLYVWTYIVYVCTYTLCVYFRCIGYRRSSGGTAAVFQELTCLVSHREHDARGPNISHFDEQSYFCSCKPYFLWMETVGRVYLSSVFLKRLD